MKLIDGYTLMHEHITINLSHIKNDEDTHLNCQKETIEEFKKLYQYGVRNIVDVTNMGMGRDNEYVSKVEKETGIQIIKSTGYYKEPFIPEEVKNKSAKELADIMIDEIENGFNDCNDYPNMIGEIGTSKNEWKEFERKLFDAAIIAHKKSGKPIYTHTTLSTLAKEQALYLIQKGVVVHKIVIGHMDLCNDLSIIRDVLKTGVNIGFDTIGKNNYLLDSERVKFLMILKEEGYLNQIVLSEDLTRKSHLSYLGGIGYCYLFETFIPMLKEAGMKDSEIDIMLKLNPKKIMED